MFMFEPASHHKPEGLLLLLLLLLLDLLFLLLILLLLRLLYLNLDMSHGCDAKQCLHDSPVPARLSARCRSWLYRRFHSGVEADAIFAYQQVHEKTLHATEEQLSK